MGSPPPHAFADRASLREAVLEWDADAAAAEAVYGNISHWNVSRVTDMHEVFLRQEVNEPLYWDTSSVTTMSNMFHVSARRLSNEHALLTASHSFAFTLALAPTFCGSVHISIRI